MDSIRLFVAVDIANSACRSALNSIQQRLPRGGVKLTAEDQFHFTLKFIGEANRTLLPNIIERLGEVEFAPFTLSLAGLGAFPTVSRPRVIWVGVRKGGDELIRLSARVQEVLIDFGEKGKAEPFKPHLTIARIKKESPRLTELLKVFFFDSGGETVIPETRVEALVLKKSTLQPDGAVYDDVYTRNASG